MTKVYTNNIDLLHQKCSKRFIYKFSSVENLFTSKLKKRKKKTFLFFPEENLEFTYEEFYIEYKKKNRNFIEKKNKKKRQDLNYLLQ